MPQQIYPIPRLTVREQVVYCGWLAGVPARTAQARVDPVLRRVGLSDKADARTTALSGGQLRRVGLAETLVVDASVLLLDEPTAGLDPEQRHAFRRLLASLDAERTPVMVTTHLVDDLEGLYDTVLVITDGRVVFAGTVEDFLSYGDGPHPTAVAESAYAAVVSADAPVPAAGHRARRHASLRHPGTRGPRVPLVEDDDRRCPPPRGRPADETVPMPRRERHR